VHERYTVRILRVYFKEIYSYSWAGMYMLFNLFSLVKTVSQGEMHSVFLSAPASKEYISPAWLVRTTDKLEDSNCKVEHPGDEEDDMTGRVQSDVSIPYIYNFKTISDGETLVVHRKPKVVPKPVHEQLVAVKRRRTGKTTEP